MVAQNQQSQLESTLSPRSVNEEITLKSIDTVIHKANDEVFLGMLLRTKDALLVMDLDGNWFQPKQIKFKVPFAISENFSYKFVICSNFRSCTSLVLPEITLVKQLADRYAAASKTQKS